MTDLETRHATTDVLDVAYHEAGPAGGQPVVLLHGFPYDIHTRVQRHVLARESGRTESRCGHGRRSAVAEW